MGESGAVAFLEFFLAAAWAGIVAAHVLERIAHRFLMLVVAMRAVHMTVIVVVGMIVMVAVWAVDVWLLIHSCLLGKETAGDYLAIARNLHAATE